MTNLRIGEGYDVHKLVLGRDLVIGGVKLSHSLGLDGHSDADVLVHAIMDALLGAAAIGDIGKLFPDNDDAYLGADSLNLLCRVCGILKENGYSIVNIDSTIIAQKPKMSPHIIDMREKIANAIGIDIECVSVKATTEEHLGFTGREEGIAARAIALIEKQK